MKVSDFEVDFDSGNLFTCCMSDVMERSEEEAKENMIIECEHCGARMRLEKCRDGALRWRRMK